MIYNFKYQFKYLQLRYKTLLAEYINKLLTENF